MKCDGWLGQAHFLRWRARLVRHTAPSATGVPISGFFPLVGIGLTDKFKDAK